MELPSSSLSLRNALLISLICICGILAPICVADTSATNAARDLARKVAAQLDSKFAIHAEFRDFTDELAAAEINDAQRTFESELNSRGLRFAAATAAQVAVKITLSRDADSRFWIAEFSVDAHPSVVISAFALPSTNSAAQQNAVLIQRQLILSRPEPILDFAFAGPPSDTNTPLLILGVASITVMRFRDRTWQLHATDLLQFAAATPRDLQGKLSVNGPNFEARLANIICSGAIADVGSTRCAASPANPWDFPGANGKSQFASAATQRNWFTFSGPSPQGTSRNSFFSAAGFAAGDQPLWAVANIDGDIRVYQESSADTVATIPSVGSQLATVQTSCGAGWQILTTASSDYSAPDSVQAQEWTGRDFRPLGSSMEFDGPVLALRRGSDGNSVRAIVHNLKNGMYEAYSLNVVCNR